MRRKDIRTKREKLIDWLSENVIDCIQREINPNVTTRKLLAIIRRDANIDIDLSCGYSNARTLSFIFSFLK